MALVPSHSDPNRDKIMAKIAKLKKEGSPESADKLLAEHNIKVGENDKKIAEPGAQGQK